MSTTSAALSLPCLRPRQRWYPTALSILWLPKKNHRVIELAQIVAETVPGSRLRFSDGFIADRRNYRVSGDLLAQTLPDLKFDWTLGEGAAELYAAYRQIGLRHDDFEGQRYQRLAHLKGRIADGSIGSDLRPNSVSGLVEVAS